MAEQLKPIYVIDELPPIDVPVYGFWLNRHGLQWWIFTRKFNYEGGWYWCWCESQDVETADDFDITHWLPMIDFKAAEQWIKNDDRFEPISRRHENGLDDESGVS